MTTIAETLISQGKEAVEAELARIEAELAAAKSKAETDAANLATALAAKISAHASEVAAAQALVSRAAVITGSPAKPVAPAITLTAVKPSNSVKNFLVSLGWKGPAVTAVALVLVHYVIRHIV